MYLDEFIYGIIEEMKTTLAPKGKDGNVWGGLISQISKQDSCDYSYCEIIQDLIVAHLANLSEQDKRDIWLETETGCNEDDPDSVHIDSVELQLEEELLDEVTRRAWAEAGVRT